MLEKILIYITCANEKEAKNIAKELIKQELIACANVMPAHIAMYDWQGKVKEEKEVTLLAKSTADKFLDIQVAVEEMHSYELPCIISIDIANGNPEFLNWIEEVTK